MRSESIFRWRQAEGGLEEDGQDATSRSILSPGGGRGDGGEEGRLEEMGSLELERAANKDQESLAFFKVPHQNTKRCLITENLRTSLSLVSFFRLELVRVKRHFFEERGEIEKQQRRKGKKNAKQTRMHTYDMYAFLQFFLSTCRQCRRRECAQRLCVCMCRVAFKVRCNQEWTV